MAKVPYLSFAPFRVVTCSVSDQSPSFPHRFYPYGAADDKTSPIPITRCLALEQSTRLGVNPSHHQNSDLCRNSRPRMKVPPWWNCRRPWRCWPLPWRPSQLRLTISSKAKLHRWPPSQPIQGPRLGRTTAASSTFFDPNTEEQVQMHVKHRARSGHPLC